MEWRVQMQIMSIKPNWQAKLTYNAITSRLLNDTFGRRTASLEKTVKMTDYLSHFR